MSDGMAERVQNQTSMPELSSFTGRGARWSALFDDDESVGRTGVDSSTSSVEGGTERVRLHSLDTTALIACLCCSTVRAAHQIPRDSETGGRRRRQRATWVRVNGRLVVREVVHTLIGKSQLNVSKTILNRTYLDNINLATRGPIGAWATVSKTSDDELRNNLPFIQNAGHVPQPVGMCTASIITSPWLNENSVVIRTWQYLMSHNYRDQQSRDDVRSSDSRTQSRSCRQPCKHSQHCLFPSSSVMPIAAVSHLHPSLMYSLDSPHHFRSSS